MKKSFYSFILICSVIGVFAGIILSEKWLDYIFKPLIMVSIIGCFYTHSRRIDKGIVISTIVAFIFSLLGDIFMMFTERGELYLQLGIFSFLIAQLIYVYVFKRSVDIEKRIGFLNSNYLYLILYFIYGGIIFAMLIPSLELEMKIAIFVYMLAISSMSAMALNRLGTVGYKSFILVFAGSVLFIISDTLIALNIFYNPIPFHRFYTMSTYIGAQYLIMWGILNQFDKTAKHSSGKCSN